ncbi:MULTISPECIES: tetratricopeptide repeat protein [Mesorhizobium]|uniref:tetratricopeptide repeat protein n=1 Tax=Mesorhizobium TaxID=68287 RepID=UPI0010100DEE|nr:MULTISPECIES: tetratricopeptide repeat protein [Mesorhizobium]
MTQFNKCKRYVIAIFTILASLVASLSSFAGALEAEAAFKAGNYEVAYKEWEEVAKTGDATAEFNIGFLYSGGFGVPQDYSKAAEWWAKAAAQNLPVAELKLGLLYSWGKGVQQDDTEAAKLWLSSAAQGLSEAQQYIGYAYLVVNAPVDAHLL